MVNHENNHCRTVPQHAEGLVLPQRPESVIDLHVLGATGRVWSMPVDLRLSGPWNPTDPSLVTTWRGLDEYYVSRVTCEFLREVSPVLYREWHSAAVGLAKRVLSERVSHTKHGAHGLLETHPHEAVQRLFQQQPRPVPQPCRISFEPPDLKPGHWLYERHSDAGNFVTRAVGKAGRRAEAESDCESISEYLVNYKKLTEELTGKRLFEATKGVEFRDPYTSCIELCLLELKLPSHFMALIHVGIGVQLALGGKLKSWDGIGVSRADDDAYLTSKRIFREVARLWREDFARE